jgi:hypothetical protein
MERCRERNRKRLEQELNRKFLELNAANSKPNWRKISIGKQIASKMEDGTN